MLELCSVVLQLLVADTPFAVLASSHPFCCANFCPSTSLLQIVDPWAPRHCTSTVKTAGTLPHQLIINSVDAILRHVNANIFPPKAGQRLASPYQHSLLSLRTPHHCPCSHQHSHCRSRREWRTRPQGSRTLQAAHTKLTLGALSSNLVWRLVSTTPSPVPGHSSGTPLQAQAQP